MKPLRLMDLGAKVSRAMVVYGKAAMAVAAVKIEAANIQASEAKAKSAGIRK